LLPEPNFYTNFHFDKEGYERATMSNSFKNGEWRVDSYDGVYDENPTHTTFVESPLSGNVIDVPLYKQQVTVTH
jgi:hypothetical protein